MKGDLIRCRDWRSNDDEWNDIGIVVEYDSLMKTVKALMQSSGIVKSYRVSHTELVKRAPQNIIFLKNNSKKLDTDTL